MKNKEILRTEEVDNRDKELLNSSRIEEYMREQMSEENRYPQAMDISPQAKMNEIVELLQGKTVNEVVEILSKVYEWVSQNARV